MKTVKVSSVTRNLPSIPFVFDITVAEDHNFFVRIGEDDVLVSNCQMLTPAAAQAILKDLEEPPSHALFILATMEPDKVIPAIHGRCQQLELERVGAEDIVERLAAVCKDVGEKRVGKEALETIAHQTGGQLRDAVQALEAVIQYLDGSNAKLKGEALEKVVKAFLLDSLAVDEQVAIKALVWLYAQYSGGGKGEKKASTLKRLMATLMDTSSAVAVANSMLYANSYLINNAADPKHKIVWHTATNAMFLNLLNKNVLWREEFGSNPHLPLVLTVQESLLALRRDLVTLNTSEIAQLQAHLGRAFIEVAQTVQSK